MRRESTNFDPYRFITYRKQQVVQTSTRNLIKEGYLSKRELKKFFEMGFRNLSNIYAGTHYYILGKSIVGLTDAENFYRKIILFSFRMIPGLSLNCKSDMGWGCLIRVGQMVMAASLKRFLLNKNNDRMHKILEEKIIVSFLENNGSKEEKYSLRRIVERAREKNKKIDYGTWFSHGTICRVLIDLHRKDRMNGTEDLSFHLFGNSTVVISEVLEKLGEKLCRCREKKIMCNLCYCEESSIIEEERKVQETYALTESQPSSIKEENEREKPFLQQEIKIKAQGKSVVVFISCQLGLNSASKEAISQVKELLKLESSLGALGGVKGTGQYITGFEGNNLIYINHNFVQQKVQIEKLARDFKTFYPEKLLTREFSDIDPSLTFAFYIDSFRSFRKLQEKYEEFNEKYESPIFDMEWDIGDE